MTPKKRDTQRHLVAGLRALILDGDVAPGERLPSVAELGRAYQANPRSISRALDELAGEGIVERRHGVGTFATDRGLVLVRASHYPTVARDGQPYGWINDAAKRGRRGTAKILSVGERPAPRPVSIAFGIERGATVMMRHQLLLLDEEPAELVWSYYPVEIARGTALAGPAKIADGSPRLLAELGFPTRSAVDRIGVRNATRDEWAALMLPADIPVLRQFRVVFTDDRRPIEVTVMVKAGQQCEVEYELPGPSAVFDLEDR
jgi:GntR family transcriptional regulator